MIDMPQRSFWTETQSMTIVKRNRRVTTDDFKRKVREAQKIAGELFWLTTRTRPDLCFSIQKMCSLATKNPVKSVQYGLRMLIYPKGTEDFGLKYFNKKDTVTKHKDFRSDLPKEAFDKRRAVVWSDASYASQEGQKSQGVLVLTQRMAPVFWKCARQGFVSLSTAEAELQRITGNKECGNAH